MSAVQQSKPSLQDPVPDNAGPPGSQPVVQLALGRDPLDRRSDLRTLGWSAVPAERVLVLLDPKGDVAVTRLGDRSLRLAVVRSPVTAAADFLLGIDRDGHVWCGRTVARDDAAVPGDAEWASLREVGMRLTEDERGILAEVLALANWHRIHPRCPRCGAATMVAGLGWWRTCPEDGSEHYPRTDPAIIALLVDEEGNALLGRQARWPQGAFSTLAGFVEPGESAESAVLREIAEEVGLHPTSTTYVASQPWPFPASLMLGFHAGVAGVRPDPRPDGLEIAEARWISRDELPGLGRSREVRLPGRLSIAHHLIRLWYGSPLPDEWCRW